MLCQPIFNFDMHQRSWFDVAFVLDKNDGYQIISVL